LLASSACNSVAGTFPLGKLSVRVLDASNAPVQGVAADLYKLTPSGKLYWRASSTGSDGIAVFGAKDGGVVEGDYVIHVSFLDLHQLAPDETNDRAVTVKEGDDTVITFHVVTKAPGI
jgi:5-hydroxyisourate hydrolase-like protein (transthyretin family)